jgi:hypothetical protein
VAVTPDISPERLVPVELRSGPIDIEALRIAREKIIELDHSLRMRGAHDAVRQLRAIKGYLEEAVGEEAWKESALF